MQWADLYKKLPTAVTAGKAPDVAVIHLDSVATMAARKSSNLSTTSPRHLI